MNKYTGCKHPLKGENAYVSTLFKTGISFKIVLKWWKNYQTAQIAMATQQITLFSQNGSALLFLDYTANASYELKFQMRF